MSEELKKLEAELDGAIREALAELGEDLVMEVNPEAQGQGQGGTGSPGEQQEESAEESILQRMEATLAAGQAVADSLRAEGERLTQQLQEANERVEMLIREREILTEFLEFAILLRNLKN